MTSIHDEEKLLLLLLFLLLVGFSLLETAITAFQASRFLLYFEIFFSVVAAAAFLLLLCVRDVLCEIVWR